MNDIVKIYISSNENDVREWAIKEILGEYHAPDKFWEACETAPTLTEKKLEI